MMFSTRERAHVEGQIRTDDGGSLSVYTDDWKKASEAPIPVVICDGEGCGEFRHKCRSKKLAIICRKEKSNTENVKEEVGLISIC